MSTRVFVGGLTYRVRERDLEKFFRKYGRIKEVAMKNGFAFVYGRDKGLCRDRDLERFFRGYGRFRDVLIKNGYGFVEFDDYRDADDAVYELNGKELLGERVAVEIARGVSGRRGDRGYGRSRSWRDKITVERARGTPRGSDQWRYGDSRGGYGDSRRSARDDMRHDRDSVNRNTRTASSYKQSLPRYGPPTRTEYRLTVENLSSRVSWQLRKNNKIDVLSEEPCPLRRGGATGRANRLMMCDDKDDDARDGPALWSSGTRLVSEVSRKTKDVVVAQGHQAPDQGHDHDPDPAADLALAQGVVAALEAAVVAAVAPNQGGHILNLNQSPNPNPPSVVALVPNPNQETAQSRNLSQSPNPDLVLGPRPRGQSPGRSPNPKPSLPRKIDLVVNDPEAPDQDPDQAANIAKVAAVHVHQ
ncbi:Serine-arginine protein 55 [Dufourea novaeangliae]|uniref:Serine-arginine protein 55 n=1 Tax=Dufourea novaeangliae TaxID=178035 RepID=A0A154P0U3_DUFNO|nr:Serine-arginine protein 55 [Dufourea novaeangliae]